MFDGDNEQETVHIALYDNKILAGCVSLMRKRNEKFEENCQYQMRGMAVYPEFQNQGYGHALLEYADYIAFKVKGADRVWFNARLNAVKLYKSFAYEAIGNSFMIEGVCEHILMTKTKEYCVSGCHCCSKK